MRIRRGGLTLLGLLALVLSVVGCSMAIPEYFYPCGPAMGRANGYHEHFLTWTPDGSSIVFDHGLDLTVVDAAGTRVDTLVDTNPWDSSRYRFHADVSPDGTRIAYSTCEFPTEHQNRYALDYEREKYRYEIAVIDLDGTGQQRLTQNLYFDHFPVWSPDGSRIAYIANPPGEDFLKETGARLYTMTANGFGCAQHGIHA